MIKVVMLPKYGDYTY